jgi:hypothetical protein
VENNFAKRKWNEDACEFKKYFILKRCGWDPGKRWLGFDMEKPLNIWGLDELGKRWGIVHVRQSPLLKSYEF